MSNWASSILVAPKKANPNIASNNKDKQFSLHLCIDDHKLNSRILTARQIKADGRLRKVVSNYPLPTIDNLLAHFKVCQYFSTLHLHSGYYHIKLTLEAAEKTTFIIDKGKWKFHSLPFSINLGHNAFLYVLGKVLAPCLESTLNYYQGKWKLSKNWWHPPMWMSYVGS